MNRAMKLLAQNTSGTGRASTGFAGLARPAAAPEPPAAAQPGEGLPATPEAAPAPAAPVVAPTREPSRSPAQVATAVRKILGGLELPSDERGNPIPVIFDQKLDAYLHERARTIKVEGGRTTASDIIRDALRTPLPSEVAKQGKALLKVRHERYGTARTTVVIPPSTIEELRIEMGRYSNRTNNLSVGALAELRVLHWATGQSDWVE